MVHGDPKYICDLKCNGATIKCWKEEKFLGIMIDAKLTFMLHLGKIIK